MAKWEYCEIVVTIGGPLTGEKIDGTIFQVSGDHLDPVTENDAGATFARLGLEGWEMFSTYARTQTGLTSNHKVGYLFKRELPAV